MAIQFSHLKISQNVEYGDSNQPLLQFTNQEETLDFIKTIMNYLEQSYNNSKALNEANAMETSSSFYTMFKNIQNNYTTKIEENEMKLEQIREKNFLVFNFFLRSKGD